MPWFSLHYIRLPKAQSSMVCTNLDSVVTKQNETKWLKILIYHESIFYTFLFWPLHFRLRLKISTTAVCFWRQESCSTIAKLKTGVEQMKNEGNRRSVEKNFISWIKRRSRRKTRRKLHRVRKNLINFDKSFNTLGRCFLNLLALWHFPINSPEVKWFMNTHAYTVLCEHLDKVNISLSRKLQCILVFFLREKFCVVGPS